MPISLNFLKSPEEKEKEEVRLKIADIKSVIIRAKKPDYVKAKEDLQVLLNYHEPCRAEIQRVIDEYDEIIRNGDKRRRREEAIALGWEYDDIIAKKTLEKEELLNRAKNYPEDSDEYAQIAEDFDKVDNDLNRAMGSKAAMDDIINNYTDESINDPIGAIDSRVADVLGGLIADATEGQTGEKIDKMAKLKAQIASSPAKNAGKSLGDALGFSGSGNQKSGVNKDKQADKLRKAITSSNAAERKAQAAKDDKKDDEIKDRLNKIAEQKNKLNPESND